MHISLVAAFSADHVLGNKGKIPWHLKEDLDNFKNLTIGSAVIMGRKTYESIGHPLSNRLNVVMTKKPKGLRGIVEVKTKKKAIEVASNFSENIYVIGGGDIYMEFIKLASTMYLTKINIEVEGDTFFPNWDKVEWEEVSRIDSKDPTQNIEYSFFQYSRISLRRP